MPKECHSSSRLAIYLFFSFLQSFAQLRQSTNMTLERAASHIKVNPLLLILVVTMGKCNDSVRE